FWSRVPPSAKPPASWKTYQSWANQLVPPPLAPTPLRTRRTEPSPMANWTTAVCLLPKLYHCAGWIRDQAVGNMPQPIHDAEKLRGEFFSPPSSSPNRKVFAVPSAAVTPARVVADWSVMMPYHFP